MTEKKVIGVYDHSRRGCFRALHSSKTTKLIIGGYLRLMSKSRTLV